MKIEEKELSVPIPLEKRLTAFKNQLTNSGKEERTLSKRQRKIFSKMRIRKMKL